MNLKKGDLTHKNYNKFVPLNNNNNSYHKFNSSKKIFNFTNVLDNDNNAGPQDNFNRRINRNQTRKKPGKINKQLNIITKNIENTNDNINNPDNFYLKFFKNIINKETQINNSNNSKTLKIRNIENINKNKINIFKYYLKDRKEKNNG